jgi:hypothetical protein
MLHRISASLLMLFCVSAGAGSTQEDRQKAVTLWDQAVAAKGGRDRLAGIRSFAIQERTRFKRPTLPEMAVGKVDQIVCELPDGWWEFLDYRPGQMGYSVSVINVRTGLGWASYGGPARPLLRPDTNAAFRMRRLQYVYFLETRWVKPNPVRASRVQRGSKSVDRVETEIEGDLVVFDLDVNTHLPVRIETVHKITLKPPRPGITGTGELKYISELDGYHEVAGIQVPARVTLGGDPSEARVEINPDYDPLIFTTPPTPDAGIDSWRKRVPPTR